MGFNPHKGQAEIALSDGKTYLLQYDNNAMAVLEQHIGAGYGWIFENFRKLIGVDFLAKAIHAGLAYDQRYKKLTVPALLGLIPPPQCPALGGAIIGAMVQWYGPDLVPETGGDQQDAPRANPTGLAGTT
jgi:hypothetical protein